MDQKPQESRHSAAYQFTSSLDELKTVLKAEEATIESDHALENDTPGLPSPKHPPEADLEAWFEEAVQDIEQFMSGQPGTST